jgi:hypothetical protein
MTVLSSSASSTQCFRVHLRAQSTNKSGLVAAKGPRREGVATEHNTGRGPHSPAVAMHDLRNLPGGFLTESQ